MKTTQFLLTFIMVCFTLAFKAQVNYKFMNIAYLPQARVINVAIDGKEVLHQDVDVNRFEKVTEVALLKKVNEYQDQDWQVMTFTNAAAKTGQPGV